ncbi:peptidase domain-containing ABC transporter [Duganella sp. S19_KUP01_CR8]|uniref:peptidase domain-containing ABC transporter n=1 Tax=Duganella sp. S19_KUP01_CR8 TaxID=3025502 RepID=UPI002FCD9EA9
MKLFMLLMSGLWAKARRRRLPVLYQSVNAECGLACAAMLASYWGALVNIHEVRERSGSSTFGLTLGQLRAVLHQMHLSTRVVSVDPVLLVRVQTPAILHWGLDHFVVLKSATASYIDIHDPSRGQRRVRMDEVDRMLSGWAIEAEPTPAFRPYRGHQKVNWRAWLGFQAAWGWRIAGMVVLALVSQLIVISLPHYLQILVDRVIPNVEVNLLPSLALLFGALTAFDWLVKVSQTRIATVLGLAMSNAFSARVFDRLLSLPLAYFEGRSLSDLASRFDSLEEIRRTWLEEAPTAIVGMMLFAFSALAMLRYAPVLLACVAICLSVYLLFRSLHTRRQEELLTNAVYLQARQGATLLETLQSIVAIKTFSVEAMRKERWLRSTSQAGVAALQQNVSRASLNHGKDACVALESIGSLYLATHLVLSGEMTVGMLVSFIAYKRLFVMSTFMLAELVFRLSAMKVRLSRLEDIALAEPESSATLALPRTEIQRIDVVQVSHHYAGTAAATFGAISFTVMRGERIALVGASGSGKSTLVKLLLALLPLKQGQVLIDGVDLNQLSRTSWLSQVGVVFQGDRLLSGTLLENICFFDPMPDRARAREAAELAHVWTEIERLPMGLNTPIQDDFSIISAGQKQRILIARALYRKPQLLVMDEGTANLDEKVEGAILSVISSLKLTVIHATHRPQVIADATRVIQIERR